MMITSFLPRVIALLIVVQLPLWALADALAPSLGQSIYDSVTEKVAAALANEKDRNAKQLTELAQHYNLAWIHLADKNKKAQLSNRPGSLPVGSQESVRVLENKSRRFVEITRPFLKGESLSLGFRCPAIFSTLVNDGVFPEELPLATVAVVFFGSLLTLGAAYFLCLGKPLALAISRLASGLDVTDEYPPYVSSELPLIAKGVKQRFSSLEEKHERSLAAARTDLSGAFAKEVEEKFVDKLLREMMALSGSDQVCELVLKRLSDEFIGVIKAGFGIEFGADGQLRIVSHWGFTEEQAKLLAALAGSPFSVLVRKVNSCVFMGADELADKRLEKLVLDLGADQCLVEPVEFNGRVRAIMCHLVISRDAQNKQKLERIVQKIAEHVAPVWHVISNYEQAYYLSRHDFLTGYRNRVFLEDRLQQIQGPGNSGDGKNEIVFLVFEGDNFRVMLNSYGPRTIDKLIQEMAQELLSSLEKSVRYKKASSRIPFGKFLYRIGACRFLLILEDSGIKKAVEMAESVCQMVAERRDWAHGLPSWSVSCGISTLSSNSFDSYEDALITLEYLRMRKSTSLVLEAKDVPEDFMSRAQSRNRGGAQNMEPLALLQQMLKAQKTGILTATAANGRVFWAYLDNGKPEKARLGNLCGDLAVVEFVGTFLEVTYRLQDLSALDAQTSEDMRSLGGAYLVRTPFNELLDLSVYFRESCADAKVHLKTPDMIVHPTLDRQAGQIEQLFYKLGKTPHELFFDVMEKFWEQCNGRLNLDEMISKMELDSPSSMLWSAADLLMQNKMIKFSRLRVSSHTDSSSERDSGAGPARPAAKPAASVTGFVAAPRACSACGNADPLSQKFCVNCGAEMAPRVKVD